MKEADETCLYADFDTPSTIKSKVRINYAEEWQKMTGKKPPKF
jgi:hypothetical protein